MNTLSVPQDIPQYPCKKAIKNKSPNEPYTGTWEIPIDKPITINDWTTNMAKLVKVYDIKISNALTPAILDLSIVPS